MTQILPTNNVLIDDRLLVAHLTGDPVLARRSKARLNTTAYWYYRACRAAILGAGGKLSGPFRQLDPRHQSQAIASMLQLPDEVALPAPRDLVPNMVAVSGRHAQLNLMNVEATAAAQTLDARVLLSPAAAQGVLPAVLDLEGIRWDVHNPA